MEVFVRVAAYFWICYMDISYKGCMEMVVNNVCRWRNALKAWKILCGIKTYITCHLSVPIWMATFLDPFLYIAENGRSQWEHIQLLPWVSCQIRKLRVAHEPGMQWTFSPPPWVRDPDVHHGTCVTHVPWGMPGSLTSSFLWRQWRGKRSRHSWRMRNPQFYVSGKRPIGW